MHYDRALKAALRGVELEPNNGFAHWRLAKVLYFRKDMAKFNVEWRRALEQNPNHAETLADVATHLMVQDHGKEANRFAQMAVQLDPNLTWVYFVHAMYFYRNGQYEESLAAIEHVNIPEFFWTHFWPAVNYAQLGETALARKEASEVLRLKPDFALLKETKIWSFQPEFERQMAEGAGKAGLPVNPEENVR